MIDFHCHIDLYPDPATIAAECRARGMYVLSVTTTASAWEGTCALSQNDGRIRTALGLHPQLAHERHAELGLFDEVLLRTPYVGEIGLDGAPEFARHRDVQLRVFNHILESCARAGGRIMSIHSRRAAGDVLDCLGRISAGVPILHWFSGSARDLDRAAAMGCWFSVGPAMLSSERGRALASNMPRDRLLTESDGPFAQIDGQPVLPWQVDDAVAIIGELWGVSAAEASSLLHENLRRLATLRHSQAA